MRFSRVTDKDKMQFTLLYKVRNKRYVIIYIPSIEDDELMERKVSSGLMQLKDDDKGCVLQ